MIRSLLESYIEKEPGYQVAVSIPGANQAPGLCDTMGIDLILMDVQTEHRENGLAAVEKIKARHPDIQIVVVTSLLDYEVLSRAKAAGADSLWYKDSTQEALMDVVRKTAAGAHIFPDRPPAAEIGTAKSTEFTRAERKVLRYLVQGLSYGKIAEAMGVEVTLAVCWGSMVWAFSAQGSAAGSPGMRCPTPISWWHCAAPLAWRMWTILPDSRSAHRS